jgi:hypothetical protein
MDSTSLKELAHIALPLTTMILNSPSADLNAEPTKFLISTPSSASVKEASLTSMESVEIVNPMLFTAQHPNHVSASKDTFLTMETVSPLPELQFPLDLFQFPPTLVDLICISLTKSAFVKRDSTLLVVLAKNAPMEPISMLLLESAELLVKPVKSTTELPKPAIVLKISIVLKVSAAHALETPPMMPRPKHVDAPQDTEIKEDSASLDAE